MILHRDGLRGRVEFNWDATRNAIPVPGSSMPVSDGNRMARCDF